MDGAFVGSPGYPCRGLRGTAVWLRPQRGVLGFDGIARVHAGGIGYEVVDGLTRQSGREAMPWAFLLVILGPKTKEEEGGRRTKRGGERKREEG